MKCMKKTVSIALVVATLVMGVSAFAGTKYSGSLNLGKVLPRATATPEVVAEPDPTPEPDVPAAAEPAEQEAAASRQEPEGYRYERDAQGNLILDENGNPVVLVPDGMEIPLTWERDADGNLVLDENGDPIPKDTVPSDANKVATLTDQLDPNRYIDIYASWEDDVLAFGSHATLIAVLYGYDNAVYTLQWQSSADDANWQDIPDATESRYALTVTEDNYLNFWRVQVLITDVRG